MVLNYIWILFFVLAFIIGLYKLIFEGDVEILSKIVQATSDSSKTAFEIALGLTGAMTFWMGMMKIGENGGAMKVLSKAIQPFFSRLFPEIPKDHPALGSIIMNYSANMLGLDNAATPLGLKAMTELQAINPNKDTASNAMIMFLTLNTAGFTIIPVSIIALRAAQNAPMPADIFLPLLIATYITMISGLVLCALWQKIKWDAVLVAWIAGIITVLAGATYFVKNLSPDMMKNVLNVAGPMIIFSIIITFIVMGFFSKINVYDTFIEGGKEGFGIAVKIIPYLVAMLVGVGVFRAAGGMDLLLAPVKYLANLVCNRTEWIDALPVGLMKPFSGSGARGLMVEAFSTFGVDSIQGRIAAIINGSHDTTFYVLALYFGSIGVRNTRYAITTGLLTDLVSIIVSILVAYAIFG